MDPTTRERELLEKLRGREHTLEFCPGSVVLRAADSGDPDDARTVSMALSSEAEVDRWFGQEILDHSPDSVRLDRLRAHGPLLSEHWGPQVGRATRVWLKDRTLRAEVRFGNSDLAETEFRDVRDGIRTGVSIKYQIHAIRLEEVRGGGLEVYRVTDWEPTHIALVAEPADTTVGVGRSLDGARRARREEPMNDKLSRRDRACAGGQIDDDTPNDPIVGMTKDELLRREEIRGVAAKFRGRLEGIDEIAESAIAKNWSLQAFNDRVVDLLGERSMSHNRTATPPRGARLLEGMDDTPSQRPGFLGLSRSDLDRYSILRAIGGMLGGRPEDAAFELECSDAVSRQIGRTPWSFRAGSKSLYIPLDVLNRAAVSKAGLGAGLVGTKHAGDEFIEMLREQNVLFQMGASVLDGLREDVDIPRLDSSSTVYWIDEDTAGTFSNPATSKVQLTPHTAITLVEVTRKMVLQSLPAVDQLFLQSMSDDIGEAIEAQAIAGSGSPITGLLNTALVGAADPVPGANAAERRANLYQSVLAVKRMLVEQRAMNGSTAWLMSPGVEELLAGTEKWAGTGQPILNQDTRRCAGLPYFVSSKVPTTGVGDDSFLILGNFTDMLIGYWGPVSLDIDTSIGFTKGNSVLRAIVDVDVAVRRPKSFVIQELALADF